MSEPDEHVDPLLSVEGLNYLTTALLYMTARRMGPEFLGEVIALAEHIRGQSEVTLAFAGRVTLLAGLQHVPMAVRIEMARMSLEKLNELLVRALVKQGGLHHPDETAFKPWLPESYWAEQARLETQALMDRHEMVLSDLAYAKRQRQQEDEILAMASVEELIGDPPGLFTPTEDHETKGWGTRPMKRSFGMLKAPTVGPQSPSFGFQCYQCGRPITVDGYDHDHKRQCDMFLMDDVEPDPDHYSLHRAKPWKGEEEDGDADT